MQRLEHSSAVKQALLDVYSAECARLQSEVKRLSVSDVASSNEGSQHQQQQQQQRDSTAAVNVQKISQVFRRSVCAAMDQFKTMIKFTRASERLFGFTFLR